MREALAQGATKGPRRVPSGTQPRGGPARAIAARDIQALMWRDVGLFRNRSGLESALAVLEPAWRETDWALRSGAALDAEGWRTASLLTVGRLIARAALRREESRGGHYRDDCPARDDIHWRRRLTDSL
jgi:L-aspartate oxidase